MKCTKCGQKNEVVELNWIGDKLIIVEGFKCKHCHQVNICKVTDNALRIDLFKEYDLLCSIDELKSKIEKHVRSNELDDITLRKIKCDENKLEVLYSEYNKLKKANTIRNRQLIEWYEQKGV